MGNKVVKFRGKTLGTLKELLVLLQGMAVIVFAAVVIYLALVAVSVMFKLMAG